MLIQAARDEACMILGHAANQVAMPHPATQIHSPPPQESMDFSNFDAILHYLDLHEIDNGTVLAALYRSDPLHN